MKGEIENNLDIIWICIIWKLISGLVIQKLILNKR